MVARDEWNSHRAAVQWQLLAFSQQHKKLLASLTSLASQTLVNLNDIDETSFGDDARSTSLPRYCGSFGSVDRAYRTEHPSTESSTQLPERLVVNCSRVSSAASHQALFPAVFVTLLSSAEDPLVGVHGKLGRGPERRRAIEMHLAMQGVGTSGHVGLWTLLG
jgi:hypothetical protein